MRPLYETQKDLFEENKIAIALSHVWNCNLFKMPKTSSVDFVSIRKSEAVGFVEIKKRTNKKNKYSTYMISKKKIDSSKQLNKSTGLNTILVVKWADELGYVSLNKDYPERQGGRYDRKDPADVETVVDIDILLFKNVVGIKNNV
tara:strand:- start:13416 stop:13850 length:435 start_codon:yes stop_codon:yes gene_type:complete